MSESAYFVFVQAHSWENTPERRMACFRLEDKASFDETLKLLAHHFGSLKFLGYMGPPKEELSEAETFQPQEILDVVEILSMRGVARA